MIVSVIDHQSGALPSVPLLCYYNHLLSKKNPPFMPHLHQEKREEMSEEANLAKSPVRPADVWKTTRSYVRILHKLITRRY